MPLIHLIQIPQFDVFTASGNNIWYASAVCKAQYVAGKFSAQANEVF